MDDYDEDAVQELKKRLDVGIGHYMAAVAEQLLTDGVPVSDISTYTAFDERTQTEFDKDVEGDVDFGEAFQHAVLGRPGEVSLHWCGVSGWAVLLMPRDEGRGFLESAHWMGAGLLPAPERVAHFLSAVRLAPGDVGSNERPHYRVGGEDLEGLVERLAEFVDQARSYRHRFDWRHGEAYRDRVLDALVAPGQETITVPLTTGELAALRWLMEFVDVRQNPSVGPGEVAHLLAEDIRQRVQHHGTIEKYRQALQHAVIEHERIAELRRRRDAEE